MNIYVGNLSYKMTEYELQQAFGEFGEVESCTIIKDRMTDTSKGFGFVEMPHDNDARSAIANLNGKVFDGRKLDVRDASKRR